MSSRKLPSPVVRKFKKKHHMKKEILRKSVPSKIKDAAEFCKQVYPKI